MLALDSFSLASKGEFSANEVNTPQIVEYSTNLPSKLTIPNINRLSPASNSQRKIMNAIALIGRILFSIIFISGGVSHFVKVEAMTGYAKYKKLPAAKLGVLLSGLMMLLGGIYVLLGVYVDLGALLIAIFCIVSAVIFHDFWKETDATAKMNSQTAFMKNMSIAGASFVLFVLAYKDHGITADNFGWVISKAHIALWK